MQSQAWMIGAESALLLGEARERGYLFVHGQGGNKQEAAEFAKIAVPAGFQVLGIDLPGHGARQAEAGFDPWTVVPELQALFSKLKTRWKSISLRANSIGAYFCMLAFMDASIDRALFVSPIVDMEKLIHDMMGWAGVTEEELRARGEIQTNFGQTLSYAYLQWVRAHPLDKWRAPTSVLYAGQDSMTDRETITRFAEAHKAALTVYEPGEHWFHTPEQLEELQNWERENLN